MGTYLRGNTHSLVDRSFVHGSCIRELNERRSSTEDYVYPKNAHRPVAHLTVGGGGGGTFKSQPWAEAILLEYVLLCVSTVPVTYEGDNAEIPC